MVLLTLTPQLTAAIEVYNKEKPSSAIPVPTTHLDHRQIHLISQTLLNTSEDKSQYRLSTLLQGCNLYYPPPPPKPEPTQEYKDLMARLRRQEEERVYNTLTNNSQDVYEGEDEYTFQDLKSQLSITANVLLSTIATSVAVWMVASGWDVPQRFALAFTCSIVVCIAEVVVFNGYLRKVDESRKLEKIKAKNEVKEVVNVWEIGGVARALDGVKKRR
ncbi:hypothetical protein L873DRAFT_1684444 [Choiromyces venosus 120613-1]|uniref:Endoplasmic reticulum-based factor for assembly of V-ATPase-domain-containing protein n=1 Tax=Choiromyces venosus 120613-1 TaxID=1336337 RepID=A0A3N4JLS0_9PEZI|nr:hypothetical protein L873DRAFT_1684444 [Choiromyces venosus 120613-1]